MPTKKSRFLLLGGLLLVSVVSLHAAAAPDADAQRGRCDTVMRAQLAKPYPPEGCWHHEDFALAAYWLNERTAEADRAILAEREKEFPVSLKDGNFHWHAYILERIYFLAGRNSKHHPGRMGAAAEAALLDMLWQWAAPRCRLEMTLFADYSRPPLIDGKPVNYAPPKVYDSPFIQSEFGSGIVTVRKGGRELRLDFNEDR